MITFGNTTATKIRKGFDAVADVAKITIGPRGRNVMIERLYEEPNISNDGDDAAQSVWCEDPTENMAAEVAKGLTRSTSARAKGARTTSLVLAQAMVQGGVDLIKRNIDPMSLRRGMESAFSVIADHLEKISLPIHSYEDIFRVARISSESEELGKQVADVMHRVGKDSAVSVELAQGTTITSEVVEGYMIDRGYVSPYMVTDTDTQEAEITDAAVLVTEDPIKSFNALLPVIDKCIEAGKSELVIIADGVTESVLKAAIKTKVEGTFSLFIVNAPGFGDKKRGALEDLAVTIGATVIARVALSLKDVEMKHLGRVQKVLIKRNSTLFVGGYGTKEQIDARIKLLQDEAEKSESAFDKEKLLERAAKISGGVALISVGAPTELEAKYLRKKVNDAVTETKAAMESGIVPGGGATLAHIAKLHSDIPSRLSLLLSGASKSTRDEIEGYRLVMEAASRPLYQIAQNAGRNGKSVVKKVVSGNISSGYDALNDKVVDDMFSAGIIDAAKIVRIALENAVSTVSTLLTVGCSVPTNKKHYE